MITSRRCLLTAGSTAFVAGAIGAPLVARAQQAEFIYKYANNLPTTHPMNVLAQELAAAIKAETIGRFDMRIFPSSQLGPTMFPIAKRLGFNDIHYAIVSVTAMNIGLMAPPFGVGFCLACKIGNVPPDEAIGAIWPYLAALLIDLVIIATLPWISIGLL
jgi:TRAP-type mannitol/chloroaromatic compound transport system permease large subunit